MSRLEERFLILAPTGRDATLTAQLLTKADLHCAVVSSFVELCQIVESDGAAGVMIAEEVFAQQCSTPLTELLARQSAWSDLPVLVFTSVRGDGDRPTAAQLLASLGNVTFLDRPLRPVTMLSAARSALRARKRQYEAREELKAQTRAVRERDQFLAMLGHELRNPLSAITMALNLDRETQNKYRDVMRRQVSHLARLVDDLLDVSRVTAGKIVLRKERVDLAALLQRCVTNAALDKHRTNVQLGEAVQLIEGDPVRLEQIVNNLLQNAAKYTPAGGRIAISLDTEDADVVLRVRDSGVGIEPEMLDRVFDLFAQAEHSLDRAKGGMGIGLTLVRNLVNLHGGRVDVASAGLNQGSLFTARFPRLKAASVPTSQEITGKIATRRHDLILVEDNDDSRELLATLLSERGHRVRRAADGPSGVEVALAAQPEVMLVDIGLPGLDGYGVAQRVRSAYGAAPYLIALTGYGQPSDRARALASGFDEHLTKPLDLKALEKLLNGVPSRNAAVSSAG